MRHLLGLGGGGWRIHCQSKGGTTIYLGRVRPMETSCLEADLGAKRPRPSQGRSLGPAAQLHPVFWFTPKHGIPNLCHQLNPFFDLVFQHPDPRYSTSTRETGAAPPNSTGLASGLPTAQHTPSPASPLGSPTRGLGGLTCHNSLSPRRLPSTSQGAPGKARQA